MRTLHLRRIDALLFVMSLIWGTNYAIVKHAFEEIDPQAFNAVRLIVSSTVFLGAMAAVRRRPPTRNTDSAFATVLYTPSPMRRRDLFGLLGLGVVGTTCYQYWFVGGLARTSVANAALIAAFAP